jgi:hypothetical protein
VVRASRWIVASSSAVLALAVCGAVWWQLQPEGAHLELREVKNVEKVRAERSAPKDAAPLLTRDPTERRHYLTEAQVIELFALDPDRKKGNVYDPWCHFRRASGVSTDIDWDEHPSGSISVRTNAEGLADDEVDRTTPRDLRVLVAGDSHTFGVCHREETWPNRLELLLAEAWPGRSFDVLNTAQGGHSFYQYLGMLEKYLDWSPDVFVVAVYAGNDFSELIGMAHALGEGPSIGLTKEQGAKRSEITRNPSNRYSVGQCYNAAYVFKTHPEHLKPTLRRSLLFVERMRAVCEASGVQLMVAIIPVPCGMDWPEPVHAFRRVRSELELTDEDCAAVDRLAQRFARGVRQSGVPVVDMTEAFRRLDPPPYWRKDQHLNVDGHDELARALFPIVTDWAVSIGHLPAR